MTAAAFERLHAGRPPEQQIINDAAAAVGGGDKIQAVKTIVLEGDGSNGNLGQDMSPDATGQAFAVTGYKRAMDAAGGRVRIEQTRTPNFTYFQGQQPQKQVLGVDGDVAYNVAPNGMATRAADVGCEGSPGRKLSPPDHDHPRGARPCRQAVEPDGPRTTRASSTSRPPTG